MKYALKMPWHIIHVYTWHGIFVKRCPNICFISLREYIYKSPFNEFKWTHLRFEIGANGAAALLLTRTIEQTIETIHATSEYGRKSSFNSLLSPKVGFMVPTKFGEHKKDRFSLVSDNWRISMLIENKPKKEANMNAGLSIIHSCGISIPPNAFNVFRCVWLN